MWRSFRGSVVQRTGARSPNESKCAFEFSEYKSLVESACQQICNFLDFTIAFNSLLSICHQMFNFSRSRAPSAGCSKQGTSLRYLGSSTGADHFSSFPRQTQFELLTLRFIGDRLVRPVRTANMEYETRRSLTADTLADRASAQVLLPDSI